MSTLKNSIRQLLTGLFTCIVFLSCQKDISTDVPDAGQQADLTTKVNSSVSGFVTDENNAPVMGANVSAGGTFTTTDKYGFFEVKNIQVVKNAAMVTVSQTGYFKGIKTYLATENKAAFFRIKLIPKITVGTINATADGSVSLGNGLGVAIPANSVVTASNGAAYTGTVNVAAHWINPVADDIDMVMPGDLRGIDNAGLLKGLTTFGMAAVELTGSAGELLQIAPGKKATLTIPLPGGAGTTAASIPLWSFDETKGLWKQEGEATKTGSSYVGEVSHFSFYNVDLPNAIVPLTFTIVDANGNPLGNVYFDISIASPNPYWGHISGSTDATGFVSVNVTPNSQYNLHFSVINSTCGSNLIQTFSVGTTAVNLGNVVIPVANTVSVTGTATDCSNAPLNNGRIILQEGYLYSSYPVTNGTFSFTKLICSGLTNVNFIAEDLGTSQQSTTLTLTLTPGLNNIGNLQACGINSQEFVTYSVNGTPSVTLTAPGDSILHNGNGTTLVSYIYAHSNGPIFTGANFAFDNTGIGVGSAQPLTSFLCSQIPGQTTVSQPATVNITEYGAVGQFIAGNFGCTVIENSPPNTSYGISCNFRIRRSF